MAEKFVKIAGPVELGKGVPAPTPGSAPLREGVPAPPGIPSGNVPTTTTPVSAVPAPKK